MKRLFIVLPTIWLVIMVILAAAALMKMFSLPTESMAEVQSMNPYPTGVVILLVITVVIVLLATAIDLKLLGAAPIAVTAPVAARAPAAAPPATAPVAAQPTTQARPTAAAAPRTTPAPTGQPPATAPAAAQPTTQAQPAAALPPRATPRATTPEYIIARKEADGMVVCGNCGALVPEKSKVCPNCNAEFED